MIEIRHPILPAVLIDGVELNRQHPDTFLIPSVTERTSAKVGELVKVGVESTERGFERFWVEIVNRIDDGRYVGRVDNDLADGWGFNYNDHIIFAAQHILATQ
ncbi:MAG TPA: hypothetical protein VK779_07645 [Rhizomicrobium sp.]|jgi:hypothetical protein|nr:hypothetical protein [Rhizomicrobium sp.]